MRIVTFAALSVGLTACQPAQAPSAGVFDQVVIALETRTGLGHIPEACPDCALDTNDPQARFCTIAVDVRNGSRYHLQTARIELPQLGPVDLPEVAANSSIHIETGFNNACPGTSQSLVSSARITTCTMPGVAEGDCQQMVRVIPAVALGTH